MNLPARIRELLSDGFARSNQDIAEALQEDAYVVRKTIDTMRSSQHINREPPMFTLSEKGAEWSARLERARQREESAGRLPLNVPIKAKVVGRPPKTPRLPVLPHRGQRMEIIAREMNANSVFDLGRVLHPEHS